MTDTGTLLVAVILATAVAVMAHRVGSLTTGGAIAAGVIGTIAVFAGWSWAVLLIIYFVSSSWLSRFRRDAKIRLAGDRIEKSGARDSIQVVANGGAFTLMALGYISRPDMLWQALAAGAIAASAADTWATEIGLLARQRPRSIISGKVVSPGTSGGVTAFGFVAAALGALVMWASVAAVLWPRVALVAALAGGLLGCIVDSVVGATLQSRRWCSKCHVVTEQRVHSCGSATKHGGGLRWLDNDGVNAVATLSGALLGAATAVVLT